MSLWVLDTDTISLFQRNHPIVRKHVSQVSSKKLAVTVITVHEQMRGWLNAIRREAQSDRLVWAYTGLWNAVRYFNSINLLNFDRAAYNYYTELQHQRIRIGTQDLQIASIVLSVNGILVTRNRRDFERVPGLRLEDWTIDEEGLGR